MAQRADAMDATVDSQRRHTTKSGSLGAPIVSRVLAPILLSKSEDFIDVRITSPRREKCIFATERPVKRQAVSPISAAFSASYAR